jgi:hypothetical protein
VTNFRTNEQTKQPDFFCYDYGYFFVKTKKTQLIEIFKL